MHNGLMEVLIILRASLSTETNVHVLVKASLGYLNDSDEQFSRFITK